MHTSFSSPTPNAIPTSSVSEDSIDDIDIYAMQSPTSSHLDTIEEVSSAPMTPGTYSFHCRVNTLIRFLATTNKKLEVLPISKKKLWIWHEFSTLL